MHRGWDKTRHRGRRENTIHRERGGRIQCTERGGRRQGTETEEGEDKVDRISGKTISEWTGLEDYEEQAKVERTGHRTTNGAPVILKVMGQGEGEI